VRSFNSFIISSTRFESVTFICFNYWVNSLSSLWWVQNFNFLLHGFSLISFLSNPICAFLYLSSSFSICELGFFCNGSRVWFLFLESFDFFEVLYMYTVNFWFFVIWVVACVGKERTFVCFIDCVYLCVGIAIFVW
jgi:hypothetical protein